MEERRLRTPSRPGRTRFALAALAALGALAVGGCAAPPTSAPAPSESPVPTATARAEPVDPIAAEVEERLAEMDLRSRASSVLMLHQPGTDPAALAEFMTTTGAGGFILMGDNVPSDSWSVAAVSAAISASDELPPLIGIDEEGGIVARLDDDTFPAAVTLAGAPPEETRAAFAERAALVRQAGADVNFGIVADMTADPDSFIFERTYGGDAVSAGDRVEQAVLGEEGLVLSTLKHFPGHGRSEADSHVSIPTTDVGYDEWRTTDAVPFERGIDAGAEVVMTGHLAYPSIDPAPATFSAAWHRILRDELGFEGLVVTDDMLMLLASGVPEYADPVANAVAALAAGNDLLLHVLAADPDVSGVEPAQLVDGIVAAVESGALPAERLDDAARHVLTARILARD
ncbi:MAG: glycoside hydrolase family 3 N-terminal domain-containing protein [Naasia sp.]